jgi:hypothetical protein
VKMKDHPGIVSTIGAGLGWLTVNLLQAAQFFAAALAGLASLFAVIIAAPRAYAQVAIWVRWIRLRVGL